MQAKRQRHIVESQRHPLGAATMHQGMKTGRQALRRDRKVGRGILEGAVEGERKRGKNERWKAKSENARAEV